MTRSHDTDWKPECSHCGDTMKIKCPTCGGKGCIDCNYECKIWCPYCTKQRRHRRLRRIDIRR